MNDPEMNHDQNSNQPVKVIQLSEHTLRAIIQETVQESLTLMGLGTADPIEMQKDFNHLREWRKTTDSIKSKSITAIVVTVVSGFLGLLVMGIKNSLHQ